MTLRIEARSAIAASWRPVRGRRMMLLDDTRCFYRGLMPEARQRCLGGYVIYVALDVPFEFSAGDGSWQEVFMAVAAPYVEHSIRDGGGFIGQVMLEAEDICASDLPEWLRGESGPIDFPELYDHWRDVCDSLSVGDSRPLAEKLDVSLFGAALPRRPLDSRMRKIVSGIIAHPGLPHQAEACAKEAALSVSRFLHLFTQEVGAPFRRFRAWKRARGLLDLVSQKGSLTDLALDSGYADSAHFSNSIRDAYGIKPRDIVAATRHMPTLRAHSVVGDGFKFGH